MICSIWTMSVWKTGSNCATGTSGNRIPSGRCFYYGALALIPVVILLLMVLCCTAPVGKSTRQIFTDSLYRKP